MCWLAIGFLLIICILTLGRSKENIPLQNIGLEENEWIRLEGSIVSKEYKDSAYGGYWQIVLEKVKVELDVQKNIPLQSNGKKIKQESRL